MDNFGSLFWAQYFMPVIPAVNFPTLHLEGIYACICQRHVDWAVGGGSRVFVSCWLFSPLDLGTYNPAFYPRPPLRRSD